MDALTQLGVICLVVCGLAAAAGIVGLVLQVRRNRDAAPKPITIDWGEPWPPA